MVLNRRATPLRRGMPLVVLTFLWALPALAQRRNIKALDADYAAFIRAVLGVIRGASC